MPSTSSPIPTSLLLPAAPKAQVDSILSEQVISAQDGVRRYLVRWKGRPESDDSWLTHEELMELNPDLLEFYMSSLADNLTRSSFSNQGRVDTDKNRGFPQFAQVYSRKNRNPNLWFN